MLKRDLIQSKELNAGDTTYLSQIYSLVQIWIARNELRLVSFIILKSLNSTFWGEPMRLR